MSTQALPDAEDRARALDLGIHALVQAPAGSGKTGLLVQRLLLALATVDAPEQCVAITFTRKAAAEIRNRVLELLRRAPDTLDEGDPHLAAALDAARWVNERAERLGWHLLEQPDRLRAMTIDSFCAQIAAQVPLLSGLGGRMAVADDPRALYLEAITALFAELEDPGLAETERRALARVLRLAGNRLDRLIGPLSDLLARREQWQGAIREAGEAAWHQAEQAALRKFVERALDRLAFALDPREREDVATMLREGAGYSAVLAWGADWHGWPAPEAERLEDYRRLARLLVTGSGTVRKTVNKTTGFPPESPVTPRFRAFLAGHDGDDALAAACATVLALPEPDYPDDLRDLREALLGVLNRLDAHLRVAFASHGETDFGQIASAAIAALRPEGGYGDPLLAADRRIRHLLVDEMQDTSVGQIELLRQITSGWTPGDGRSLFLVGDPQQSIYAFRKAEVRLFLELWNTRRLGDLELTRLRLSANFRSDPAVVNWFNDTFTTIFPADSDEERGVVAFAPSVARRPASPGAGVRIAAFARTDPEGAAWAAAEDAARFLTQGSVAVLARTRKHLLPVIRALRERGLTPSCQDIDPLEGQPAVRDFVALLRALWHPADRLAWAALLRAPFVGLSWADLVALSANRSAEPWPERLDAAPEMPGLSEEGRERVRRLAEAIEQTRASASLRARLVDRAEAVWLALGGPGCLNREELDDWRQALLRIRAHARGGGIEDLAALERGLAELYAAPRAGQVQLMTLHKAKGLEFDRVLLVGLNAAPRNEDRPLVHLQELAGARFIVPKPPAFWPDEHPAHGLYKTIHDRHVDSRRHEALRLLYVAVTRARHGATLYVCAESDAAGVPRFAANSFAKLLEPVLRRDWPGVPFSPGAVPAPAAVPVAPRLPLDYRYRPATDGLYRPPETRTLKPSEAVLAAEEEASASRRADEGDFYAQLVGTLVHEALQKVAEQGLAAWADRGVSRRSALGAGLRRRGLPETQVGDAVERVLSLLAQVLGSVQGRWLLGPKRWARNEYALAGWHEGRWVSAVIDRCFEDDGGGLWIVDYKTSAHPVAPERIETYVATGADRYRGQIVEYVRLLEALKPGPAVRAALYFIDADRLVEISQG